MENTMNELQRMWKKDLVTCHNAMSEDRVADLRAHIQIQGIRRTKQNCKYFMFGSHNFSGCFR
jgi:hypothetical protein